MSSDPEPKWESDLAPPLLLEILNESLAEARREGARREALMIRQFERYAKEWEQATPLDEVEARLRAKFGH